MTGDRPPVWPSRGAIGLLTTFLLVASMLAVVSSGAGAHALPLAAGPVLAITQSPALITEGSALTVSMELASSANVTQVWFTFCQLTSSLCYTPVTMTPTGGNWYVGTTERMSNYNGMTPGVRAGYNITVVYADNSTFTEPSMPNAFPNLTVARTIVGSYEFEMMVSNPVYGLSGHVMNGGSGKAVVGANVTVSSANTTNSTTTNGAGDFAFAGLANGTYTLTVTDGGFQAASESVVVAGRNAELNVTLSAPSSTPDGSGGNSAAGSLMGVSYEWLALAGAVVVAVAVGAILLARSRRRAIAPPGADQNEDLESRSPGAGR